jgi:hypothetical protein
VMAPWVLHGTKDCGQVITHAARSFFELALRGLPFARVAAKLIRMIHDEQITRLREAQQLKSKPHSIRRVILNLVQTQFYSQAKGDPRHHEMGINNIILVAQLLLHDLLVDSAVHESLAELLRPKNRPDALSRRLDMACKLLSVAGPRLEQGVNMDPYYAYLQKLAHSPEVTPQMKQLVETVTLERASWLRTMKDPQGDGQEARTAC